ncbi:MAG: AsmA family protein [Candidatus Omnitrophica bacterium]|nr:AsmA family protein [Candidatus Omnitrophota bacterium]
MKILKTVFISIAVLIFVSIIAITVFLRTFDINKYLPQVTEQIGKTINRQVVIDHLSLNFSLTNGASLGIKGVTIKDDASFSTTNFLKLDEASLGLEFFPLLRGQIHVSKVLLSSPHISIIRSSEGLMNIQTMVPVSKSIEHSNDSTPTPVSTPSTTNNAGLTLPAISIKSITLENGEISFEDKNPKMPLHVVIKNIGVTINNFSLTDTFDFVLHLNLLSKDKTNVDITGHCSLDLSKNGVHVSALKIQSNLNQLDLAQVKKISTILESIPVWPEESKGNLTIAIPTLDASAKGLDKINLQVSITDGSIKLKELLSPITNINLDVETDLNQLNLKTFKANIGTGEITAQGNIGGLLTTPKYTMKLETKAIKVDELLDEKLWPAVVKGSINSQLSLSGESFDPEAMQKNLKGDGILKLSDGKIEKLNILDALLGKLNFIPGLGNQLSSSLSDSVKNKLGSDTTILDKAESKIKIQDKVVSIIDGDVESKIFSITAQGTVGFDSSVAIDVNIYLAQDLSADLIKSAQPLSGLLDSQQRLHIPGKVSGQGSSVQFKPQVDDITKKAAVAAGSEQLGRILDKNPGIKNILNQVLGSDEKTTDSSSGAQPQEKSSKELINNVLNKFLK